MSVLAYLENEYNCTDSIPSEEDYETEQTGEQNVEEDQNHTMKNQSENQGRNSSLIFW